MKRWLERIFTTQENEISCTQCFQLVSTYVERELAGEEIDSQLEMVKQHLHQCQVCQEEYEILREMVEGDDQ